jgi:Tfp pilus assembly protein PilN
MPPAQEHNINLLPQDLQKSKKSPKSDINFRNIEYTSSEQSTPKYKTPKKSSFFSKLFSVFKSNKKPKQDSLKIPNKDLDLPDGTPLNSALFVSKPTNNTPKDKPEHIVKEKISNQSISIPQAINKSTPRTSVDAGKVMSMHVPDFVSKQSIKKEQSVVQQEKFKVDTKQPTKPITTIQSKDAILEKKVDTNADETKAPVHRVSSLDVNLLSAEYIQAFDKSKPGIVFGVWVVITALLVGLSYGLLHMYHVRSIDRLVQVEKIVEALNFTIDSYETLEKEDIELRSKISSASQLLDQHLSWYQFLQKLEQATIPETTYISMSASTQGSISISAFTNNYTSVARQIVVYQQAPWIKNIGITSASNISGSSNSESGVSFDILLEINKDTLLSIQ